MFPTEAFEPWAPLAVGVFVFLGIIAIIANVIRNRVVRALVILPVVAFGAKLAWDYMVAAGI